MCRVAPEYLTVWLLPLYSVPASTALSQPPSHGLRMYVKYSGVGTLQPLKANSPVWSTAYYILCSRVLLVSIPWLNILKGLGGCLILYEVQRDNFFFFRHGPTSYSHLSMYTLNIYANSAEQKNVPGLTAVNHEV